MGDGTALKFNGSNAYLDLHINESISSEDFTISVQLRDIEYINLNSHLNTIYASTDSDPSSAITLALYAKNCGWATTTWNDHMCIYFAGLSGESRKYVPGIQNLTNFHFAIIRKNLMTSVAINGVFVLKDIPPIENKQLFGENDRGSIGYQPDTGMIYKYAKFTLDDFCIIKGKALWTENFTPPTTYLPDKI